MFNRFTFVTVLAAALTAACTTTTSPEPLAAPVAPPAVVTTTATSTPAPSSSIETVLSRKGYTYTGTRLEVVNGKDTGISRWHGAVAEVDLAGVLQGDAQIYSISALIDSGRILFWCGPTDAHNAATSLASFFIALGKTSKREVLTMTRLDGTGIGDVQLPAPDACFTKPLT